jgi:hypothetical protein
MPPAFGAYGFEHGLELLSTLQTLVFQASTSYSTVLKNEE